MIERPPSLQAVKTYWHPVPQVTGETAAIVCVDPITQAKVSDVLTGAPSTVTYPEPVGFEVIVMMTPKFAVSVIGAFIVMVAERTGARIAACSDSSPCEQLVASLRRSLDRYLLRLH